MERKYLVTYAYKYKGNGEVRFHYTIVDNVEKFIDKTQKYEDGTYHVVNVLKVSRGFASKFEDIE